MGRGGNESLKIPDVRGHLPVLDGYRGLAILLAFSHHYFFPLPGLDRFGLHQVGEASLLGLDFFFVLSGFLITGILLDTRGQPHCFRNFYMRRSLRIVPLYYLVLVFFLILLPHLLQKHLTTIYRSMMWAHESRNWPWYFGWVSNFLFVKRDGFAPSGLDVTWSLGIEEQYYITWAIIVFIIGSRRLARICLGLVAAALVVRVAMLLGGASWIQVHVMTFARMDGLAMGGLIAMLMRSPAYDPARFSRWGKWAVAGAIILLIALLPLGSLRRDTKITLSIGYTLAVLLASGTLVALIHLRDGHPVARIFDSRFLRFFGRYSYGMYLIHVPVRDELRRRFFSDAWLTSAHGLNLIGRQLLVFVTAGAVTILLSYISWHLYEKQWLKLKNHFPKFSRPPKPKPATPVEAAAAPAETS